MGGSRRRGERRGVAFALVLAFTLILAVGGAAFVALSGSEIRAVRRQTDSTRAFYIAEGGAERALAWLKAQSSPPEGTDAFDPLGGAQPLGAGSFTITIDPDDAILGLALNRYRVRATGVVGGSQREVELSVQVDSFARYSYFTDDEHMIWWRWKIPVWFITGDYLEGPVHTNSHYHISGDPVFAGPVSSVDDFVTYMHSGPPRDNPEFQQGLRLGVDSIEMPKGTEDLQSAAASGGLLLSGDTAVTLLADGTMNVTNAARGWVDENLPLPANGVLFVDDGDLTISGMLDGQLTAGSRENIIVSDNILYNVDPRFDPTSTDLLGLVAEDYVVVSRDAPYDLEIDATIMAVEKSFMVERWWRWPPKGTLTIYGGLIQDRRGPIGTFSGWSGRRLSGYSKDYHYDPRLLESPPPHYPTTGDYVVLSWREE